MKSLTGRRDLRSLHFLLCLFSTPMKGIQDKILNIEGMK